jgi:hypothetical protein
MEDYQAAYQQRKQDVEALMAAQRCTAAMHFGGVAIECLLKAIILAAHPPGVQMEWKTETRDPGHTITNPGHNYWDAVLRNNRLRDQFQNFPAAKKWLNQVESPGKHFIDMRYDGRAPDEEKYKEWKKAYKSLEGWLSRRVSQF